MKYTIVIEKPAEKFITRLAQPEKERVLRAIHELPYKGDIDPFAGGNGFGCRATMTVLPRRGKNFS